MVAVVLLVGCKPQNYDAGAEKDWDEIGHTPFSDIKSGIPAYDKTTVTYNRGGIPQLTISLGEPIVLGVATQEEPWGIFQFPSVYYGLDGDIIATWSMHPDSIASYGKEAKGYSISKDGGESWTFHAGEELPKDSGLLLPNGDRIKIHTTEALKLEDLQLPKPVGESHTYYPDGGSYTYLYKVSELPDELQGVYLSRLKKGEKTWHVEHDKMNDPLAVRYSRGGLFPVVWRGNMHVAGDGSAIAGVYPGFSLNSDGTIDASGVFFYRSEDNGHSWDILSRIPYVPDLKADPFGDKRLIRGYHEPAFEILPDGSFLCVMRTSDGLDVSPIYITRSVDMGRTWSKPRPFTRNGVKPQLVQLENGVIALASGRPGMQLRFCTDGKGEHWTDPFEMLPYDSDEEKMTISCGYPSLLAIGNNAFLIMYSDFKFQNQAGELRKAIKIRRVEVSVLK